MQELARGVEVVHDCAVLENEVGEVEKEDVAFLQVGEVYPFELEEGEEPGQLQEEPEYLVGFVDPEELEEVVSLEADSLLPAVVFGEVFHHEALRAYLIDNWKLGCLQ